MNEIDVVRLKRPYKKLKAGAEGTIVQKYPQTDEVYYVEFMDDDGNTIALCNVPADYLEVIWDATETLKEYDEKKRLEKLAKENKNSKDSN